MALDDILKTSERYDMISALAEAAKKDPDNPDYTKSFLAYASTLGPLDIDAMAAEIDRNPRILRRMMSTSERREKSELVQKVDENKDAVISALPEEQLQALSVQLPDKDKPYIEVMAHLEEGNTKAVRAAYAETFDNPVWKEFIKTADEKFIREYAARFVAIAGGKFLEKKGIIAKGEGDEPKFNKEAAISYILESVGKLDGRAKEEAYVTLGRAYAESKSKK
jgi:predicted outer membrane protein